MVELISFFSHIEIGSTLCSGFKGFDWPWLKLSVITPTRTSLLLHRCTTQKPKWTGQTYLWHLAQLHLLQESYVPQTPGPAQPSTQAFSVLICFNFNPDCASKAHALIQGLASLWKEAVVAERKPQAWQVLPVDLSNPGFVGAEGLISPPEPTNSNTQKSSERYCTQIQKALNTTPDPLCQPED